MKKPATKLEKAHMDKVASLGCIVCLDLGYTDSPAAVHHVIANRVVRDHWRTIPLCPAHHQNGGHGVAIHAGRKTWEANYGSEESFLERVNALVGGRPE